MNKEKKIYSKLIEASNQISKNKRANIANWVFFDVPKKRTILKIKEWLEEKKKPYGLDAEFELTKILNEEILKAIESEKRTKNI